MAAVAQAELPEQRAASHGPLAAPERSGGDVQDLILACNKDGMENLRQGNMKGAFEQFKYAEAILLANQMENDNASLLAVTCNNLGCYYKKVGKLHGALSYLRRALKMEVDLKTDEVTLAGTHLNLCATLSKLEKHDKAVQHALCALELMSKRVSQTDLAVSSDDYSVLAISYHNVAMEREYLEQWDKAATACQTGYQVAKRLLGENHPLSLTLGANCEAVLIKAKLKGPANKKHSSATRGRPAAEEAQEKPRDPMAAAVDDLMSRLPPVPGASPGDAKDSPTRRGAGHSAVDWVKSEEALWANFAAKALTPSVLDPNNRTPTPDVTATSPSLGTDSPQRDLALPAVDGAAPKPVLAQLAQASLMELKGQDHPMPEAFDMGAFRINLAEAPAERLLKRTPFSQALEDHPEALMDIVDAEGDGHAGMRSAPTDMRPNRSMKRATRTSRVLRRTGIFNSTTHRDNVEAELSRKQSTKGARWKSAHAQKLAAEKIQRVWRSWYAYCQENSEWMTITWICATMIQSHWRSYHVRRLRMDAHARVIQRHCRGFLVRSVLRRHTAAVTIQRRMVGILTRKRLRELHEAACTMQRLVRGGLARKRFRELRRFKYAVAITIQKHVRVWMAKRIATHQAGEKRYKEMLLKATVDLQRLFRGWKGRQLVEERRMLYKEARRKYEAARRVQTAIRKRQARRKVDGLREQRLKEMEKAATFLRKVWIGARTRKRYLQLREEFQSAQAKIVTIQRYMRGCICRLRLWREAVKMEEELWAAVEIQRLWRGYRGRVAWEEHFEWVWRREMSAALIQRNVRGCLDRLMVNRRRRKLARAEFERARDRFRAAQRIQALVRGVLKRKVTRANHARKVAAAVCIQRIARGKALRTRLWSQVRSQRATMIEAAARGFLVRRRCMRLIAKVVLIQRHFKHHLILPEHVRAKRRDRAVRRKTMAVKIQRAWRIHAERKEVKRIQGAPAR